MIRTDTLNIRTLDEVIEIINSDIKPVVFWDTCSLIDIIRVSLPSKMKTNNVMTRIVEIKDVILQEKVYSLSSELCLRELSDNIPTIIQNYLKELDDLDRTFNSYVGFINNSGLISTPISQIRLSNYKLLELFFCKITQTILNSTIFIKSHKSFIEAAHLRLVNKTTPAKNKNEYKDCVIWESCLQTRSLHNDKSNLWVFISSNTSDYTNGTNTITFDGDIENETTLNRIKYASNFDLLRKYLSDNNVI
jgi:hypothetical protein